MACCGSSDAATTSKDIDKWLQTERKQQLNQIKLLLLGTVSLIFAGPGESGKTTIFKQMKILQKGGGFSPEELRAFTYIVYGNIISQMKAVITASYRLRIEIKSEVPAWLDRQENRMLAAQIDTLPTGGDSWSPDVAEAIKRLWRDPGIHETYSMRDQYYQLNDSSSYFFDHLERIMAANYVPTEADVLRARVRSMGIQEAEFQFEDMRFKLLDVGGQRSERRRWIHCFDKVTAVMFCVAMSEYDQVLREDETQNRMVESLMLFDEICNAHWSAGVLFFRFKNSAIILFLNKVDIFKEKLVRVPLSQGFPAYTGGPDFDSASGFVKNMFLQQNKQQRPIYSHFTCAISTENVEFVFNSVRQFILRDILNAVTGGYAVGI